MANTNAKATAGPPSFQVREPWHCGRGPPGRQSGSSIRRSVLFRPLEMVYNRMIQTLAISRRPGIGVADTPAVIGFAECQAVTGRLDHADGLPAMQWFLRTAVAVPDLQRPLGVPRRTWRT